MTDGITVTQLPASLRHKTVAAIFSLR